MQGNILIANKQICPREWEVEGTYDAFHRIYYVYKGSVTYKIKESCRVLKHKHLYILPANEGYEMAHDPDNPFEVMWFHLEAPIPLVLELLEIPIVQGSVEESLIGSLERMMGLNESALEKILEALIIILQDKYKIGCEYPEHIQSLVLYVHQHIHQSIHNEELAGLIGYNKNYLIRNFKGYVGVSPRQYIIKTKMNYARRYLSEGYSVKETAGLLGYSDVNVLSRDFKRYYGKNPSYYIGNRTQMP